MRTTVLAAVAAAALGLALTNTSGVAGTGNSFLGQAAPEIQVGDWINGDGRTTLEDYRGEVVFLEFWGTH